MRIFAKRKPQQLYRRVIRFILRLIVGSFAFIILALMLIYGAILVRPQGISGYVESSILSLNRNLVPYELQLDDVRVNIHHIGAPVLMEADGIRIFHEQTELVEIPKISLQFGVQLLPYPRLIMRYAQVSSPELHADTALFAGQMMEREEAALLSEENNTAVTPEEAAQRQHPPATLDSERWQQWRKVKSGIRRMNRIMRMEAFSITDGRIQLPREVLSSEENEARLNVELTYRRKTLNGTLDLQLPPTIASKAAGIAAPGMQLRLAGNPDTGDAVLSGTVDGIVMSHFSMLPMPEWLAGADMPLNVEVSGKLKHESLTEVHIQLQADAGRYRWPELFPAPLEVQKLNAVVDVEGLGTKIHVRDIQLTLPDVVIQSRLELVQEKLGYGLSGSAKFKEVPTDRLAAYWPLTLAPLTREWAVSNLHDGVIKNAAVDVAFTALELTQPVIPAKSLKADMRVEGAKVQYLPSHPPATDVHGNLHFTGRSMELAIERADYMTATKVSNGTLRIPDFHAAETALTVEFDVDTTASDVARLFATPEVNLAKKLNLSPTAKGSASGYVRIGAIIFSSLNPPPPGYFTDNFDYEVRADTKGLGQDKFMNETDISDGRLHIEASTQALLLEGDLGLYGVPAKLKMTADFTTNDSRTDVQMQLPAGKLPAFGYPLQQGISGELGVQASMIQTGKDDYTDVKIDLSQAVVALPEAGLNKALKAPGMLSMTTRTTAQGESRIDNIRLEAPDTLIQGKALLGADGMPKELEIPVLKSGRQQANIRYTQGKDGPVLRISGESLDLAPWRKIQEDAAAAKPKVAGNPLDFGPLDAKIQLQKLWLAPDVPIYDVAATIRCTSMRCVAVDFRGQVPNTNEGAKTDLAVFNLSIANQGGARQFSLNAEDGGSLLAALGITNHIRGGKASIEGQYADKETGQPLSGKIKLKEFYLTQAPLITRILSLTSPVGFVNALSGKGINFNVLVGEFTFREGTVELKDTRANGSALGFTTQGTVQLGSTELELEGTVVPAYMINSALGNIPVVGELLTGGKGEGIIATNYSVSGSYDDPTIRVNPLSMLTPGFLRRFFDIFDGAASTNADGSPAVTNPRGESRPRTEINKNDKGAAAE